MSDSRVAAGYCAEVSVRGRRWDEPRTPETPVSHRGLPQEIADVIAGRGIRDVGEFLQPSFRGSMPDPYALKSMREAVERFCDAVERGERIAVYGDYDVDGATSTAVVTRFLRWIGVGDSVFYIPDRMTEGYGPNAKAMETLRGQGVGLVVVLDSGTTAHAPLRRAAEIGLGLIVIDHHEPDAETPDLPAILVNPKRADEDRSLSYLCTAGLAFLFVVAAQRELRQRGFYAARGVAEPDLKPLLGVVALGTVCDMVPLVGLNRAYVKLGIPLMGRNPGLTALKRVKDDEAAEKARKAGKTSRRAKPVEFSSYTCGFVFGPCINAGGRISDTMQGSRLLVTDDPAEAEAIARRLSELNADRQQMQKGMIEQAAKMAEAFPDDKVLVLHEDTWHPGVVGLVASKVKDMFDRSVFVIGTGGKGSARAMPKFDIGSLIIEARRGDSDPDSPLHTRFGIKSGGGHAAAGGITIDPERIPAFREWANEKAKDYVQPPTRVDMVVECGAVAHDLVGAMEAMAPFGMGNPEPRVAVVGGVVEKATVLSGQHVKAVLRGPEGAMELISFYSVDTPMGDTLLGAQGFRVDVLGHLSISDYNGAIQIKPDDVMLGPVVAIDDVEALSDAAD